MKPQHLNIIIGGSHNLLEFIIKPANSFVFSFAETDFRKMNMIPSFDFFVCGLSASAFSFEDDDDTSSWSLFDFGKDTLCGGPRVVDESVETIFRPISAGESSARDLYLQEQITTTWDAPIGQNKSVTMSVPSTRGEVNDIDRHKQAASSSIQNSNPTSSPKSLLNVIPNEPNSPGSSSHQLTVDPNIENLLPEDFIPPRHVFSRSFDIRETGSSLMATCMDTTPSPPVLKQPDSSSICVTGTPTVYGTIQLQPNDVICGRGSPSCIHTGNLAFKRVIKKYEMEYLCSKRSDKPKIALKLLEVFRGKGMRFVKREREPPDNGRFVWVEIDDKQAYEKICQSLREGAPHLRRQMMANQASRRTNSTGGSISRCYGHSSSSHTVNNMMKETEIRPGHEVYGREFHSAVPSAKRVLFDSPVQMTLMTHGADVRRDARDDRNYSMRHLPMDPAGGWIPHCRTD